MLPDCIAIAFHEDGEVFPYMASERDQTTTVIMPLATDRLLVGRSGMAGELDLQSLNSSAIACSHRFFLCSSDASAFAELAATLGDCTQRVVRESLDEALASLRPLVVSQLETPLHTSVSGDDAPARSSDTPAEVAPLSYQISFAGCADEEVARQIAGVVQAAVDHVRTRTPLDRLDGLTFAADYRAALASVDRGRPELAQPNTVGPEIGEGFAMPVLVWREGTIKVRLILASWIGHNLLGEASEAGTWALYNLFQQLGFASVTQLQDEAFPGRLLQPFGDRFEGTLYEKVHGALESYLAGSFAAPYGSGLQIAELISSRLLAALQRACQEIPQARLAYRRHGDLGQLLAAVDPMIRELLTASAVVLGHWEGSAVGGLEHEADLPAALDAAGLRAWFKTFQTDLQRLGDRWGRWGGIDEFTSFNQHVRRLYWQFGLFPSRVAEGGWRLDIPLATDMPALMATAIAERALEDARSPVNPSPDAGPEYLPDA